jgi:hypothetical protein
MYEFTAAAGAVLEMQQCVVQLVRMRVLMMLPGSPTSAKQPVCASVYCFTACAAAAVAAAAELVHVVEPACQCQTMWVFLCTDVMMLLLPLLLQSPWMLWSPPALLHSTSTGLAAGCWCMCSTTATAARWQTWSNGCSSKQGDLAGQGNKTDTCVFWHCRC